MKQELDFPKIRENFKSFLSSQEEFTDYDLTQSGLDVIINLMSYGIHYDALTANILSSEIEIDTAQIRKNVVSKAKRLSYFPKSSTAAKIVVDVNIEENGQTLPNTLFLPKGTVFVSKNLEYKDVNFITVESYMSNKVLNKHSFLDVPLYQGSFYTIDKVYKSGDKIEIKNQSIDDRFVEVYVEDSVGSNTYTKFEKVTNILTINKESNVFFIEENFSGNYDVYFGDGVLGKAIPENVKVIVTYLVTKGTDGNGITSVGFTKTTNKTDPINSGKIFVSLKQKASGGTERESIESIRFNATRFYPTQKIILNDVDANFIIPNSYNDIKSVNIWSGKNTGVFGKTYISLNPYIDNLTDERINEILSEIEKQRFVVLTKLEHVRPIYIDVGIKIHVYFSSKDAKKIELLKQNIYDKILTYSKNNIEDFKKNFISSKFINDIYDQYELEYDFSVSLKERITAYTNTIVDYSFDFQNELLSITSNEFIWQGSNVYLKNDNNYINVYSASDGKKISTVGSVDLLTGSGTINNLVIQSIDSNILIINAEIKKESIFSKNNNILRILEKDIEITYENKD